MEASPLSLSLLPSSAAIIQPTRLTPALASSSDRSILCCNWQMSCRAACLRLRKTKCWESPGANKGAVCVRATVDTGHTDCSTMASEVDALESVPEGNAAAETQIDSAQMVSEADALSSEHEGNAAAETQSSDGGDVAEAVSSRKKPKSLSPGRLARRAADWKRAESAKENGEVVLGQVESLNKGGLVVRFYSILGFLPFSQLNIVKDEVRSAIDVGKDLIGTILSLKVLEANQEAKRLTFSEREAVRTQQLKQLQKGDLYEGRVNGVTDYGAFVDLKFPDGSYPLNGLVHISEISWDLVRSPRDVLQVGQEVRVKIINVDLETSRFSLSMKQLEADPLLETLDSLMPVDVQESSTGTAQGDLDGELIGTYLPGIENICEELLREEGVTDATLGRQAFEKRVVSQDLELWLSNAVGENGTFTLVARAGKQVQEIHVTTKLDREGMKTAVQRVTSRLP